ncbi:squidulin [Acrasis kona]|uniref:Squidulin n=1 Tax=Acrasis kona TaxID=1008807 RepID=A0AAW2YHQ7_9EUKA
MSSWEKLNEEQKEQIKAAFDICDNDQNGFIDLEELKEVLKALGESATDQQAKELMKEIDTDGNGLISIEEFCEAMADWWLRA